MYDLIIIGGGPAGLSGAIYASRYNLKVVVLTELVGGQISESMEVENYPGTIKATGFQLMQQWQKHAESFGAEIVQDHVESISKVKNIFKVKTSGSEYESKALLFATGAHHKTLGVKGEAELQGRGVSYCPTCDGMFFKDKIVAVVGGGDAALRGVQVLLQFASKVYLIHRRNEFRAEPILVEKLKKDKKVEFLLERNVKEIKGTEKVSSIVLDNNKEVKLDGIFIEVGHEANISLIEKLGVKTEEGLVKTNADQSTNVPGLYAAGDVTTGSNKFRQVVTAASEGAIAAQSIFEYVKKN